MDGVHAQKLVAAVPSAASIIMSCAMREVHACVCVCVCVAVDLTHFWGLRKICPVSYPPSSVGGVTTTRVACVCAVGMEATSRSHAVSVEFSLPTLGSHSIQTASPRVPSAYESPFHRSSAMFPVIRSKSQQWPHRPRKYQQRMRSTLGTQITSANTTASTMRFTTANRWAGNVFLSEGHMQRSATGKIGPGPLGYSSVSSTGWQPESFRPTAAAWRFPTADRWRRLDPLTPGPGAYNPAT